MPQLLYQIRTCLCLLIATKKDQLTKTKSISTCNLRRISIRSLIAMLRLLTHSIAKMLTLVCPAIGAIRASKDARIEGMVSLTLLGTTKSATTGSILTQNPISVIPQNPVTTSHLTSSSIFRTWSESPTMKSKTHLKIWWEALRIVRQKAGMVSLTFQWWWTLMNLPWLASSRSIIKEKLTKWPIQVCL